MAWRRASLQLPVSHQEVQENSSEATRKLGASSKSLQENEEIQEMISLKKI